MNTDISTWSKYCFCYPYVNKS